MAIRLVYPHGKLRYQSKHKGLTQANVLCGKKPTLFLANGCYLPRPMSRLAFSFFAALALAALNVSAQTAQPAPTVAPLAPQPAGAPPIPAPDANALKWDADTKDYNAKQGDTSAAFTFAVTNVSKYEVAINRLSTSCGCTVAQLPSTPYKLQPGSNVTISVSMDLHGKVGAVTKTVSVDTAAGFKSLMVRANIPQPANTAATPGAPAPANNSMGDRAKNIQNALADRQAVFKGECAKCHVDKGVGKMGKDLYVASCGVCHEAEHRAAMVPDLKVPRSPRDLAFWQKWIMEGKPGTLMPAFAQAHGGPLTQEQVDSLTVYLYQTMPKTPPPVAVTPAVTPALPIPQKN
jgi:mono/diheme cytochrome c family protein